MPHEPKDRFMAIPQHLLLIEDDTFLAGMYVTKLTMENFQVDLANDGKSGLEKAKTPVPVIEIEE